MRRESLSLGFGDQTSDVPEARLQFPPDKTSNQQGNEGADPGSIELGFDPIQAFVHLQGVDLVREFLADLTSNVLKIRVDLGLNHWRNG